MRKPKNPYEFCDRHIEYLTKYIVSEFTSLKATVLGIDEIHRLGESRLTKRSINKVTNEVNKRFANIDRKTKEVYLLIAEHYYKKTCGKHFKDFDLLEYLMLYDPVCKYVYANEFDRKRSRLIEVILSSDDKVKDIDYAKRLLTLQMNQECLNITDDATLSAYKNMGIKKLKWITRIDGRECITCHERHNTVYAINKVPAKPHRGCRCRLIPTNE